MALGKVELRQQYFAQQKKFRNSGGYEKCVLALKQNLANFLRRNAQHGSKLLIYNEYKSEPPISLLFANLKYHLFFPQVVGQSLYFADNKRRYIHLAQLDFIFLPGLYIDKGGYRLGRGGGYYDRILPFVTREKTVFLGFNWQMLANIPLEAHDRPVGHFIADTGHRQFIVTRK